MEDSKRCPKCGHNAVRVRHVNPKGSRNHVLGYLALLRSECAHTHRLILRFIWRLLETIYYMLFLALC